MMHIVRGLLGLVALLAIGVVLSERRSAIKPRIVVSALVCQVAIGALVLFVPWGRVALGGAASAVNRVIGYGYEGMEFMFGGLVGPRMHDLFGDTAFVFAFRVLPAIIYMSALIGVLYHIGVMRWIVAGLGSLFHRLIGVSKLESFSAVTTIFVGQSEMPVVLRPYVSRLQGPELFAVMSSGMAAVAGSTLAGYAGLGVRLEYLLAASFMAIPGGLLFAKIICPTVERSALAIDDTLDDTLDDARVDGAHIDGPHLVGLRVAERPAANVIEATAAGAALGLRVAVNVGAMLIAFIGIIALLNGIVSAMMGWFGFPAMNLESLIGHAFAPLAWLIGVPWQQAGVAGNLIGQKIILNEFVGYASFARYLAEHAGPGTMRLDPKTIVIVSFALCGFANFSSIGILAGGFGAVAPALRAQVARYGLRAVAAASLSNLASAAIAGALLGAGG
jgi:CNT family concentrative nucleoside transporter